MINDISIVHIQTWNDTLQQEIERTFPNREGRIILASDVADAFEIGEIIYVIRIGERLVGCAIVRETGWDPTRCGERLRPDQPIACIDRLEVSESSQRQGIGTVFVRFILERYPKPISAYCTHLSRLFWEKLGFVPVSRQDKEMETDLVHKESLEKTKKKQGGTDS